MRVQDESAGRRVTCPGCSAVTVVPSPDAAPIETFAAPAVVAEPQPDVAAAFGNVFVAAENLPPRKPRESVWQLLLRGLGTNEGKIVLGALVIVGGLIAMSVFAPGLLGSLGAFAVVVVIVIAAVMVLNSIPNGAYRLAIIPVIMLFTSGAFWQMTATLCLAVLLSAGIIIETIKGLAPPPAGKSTTA